MAAGAESPSKKPRVDAQPAAVDGDALLKRVLASAPVRLQWNLDVPSVEALSSSLMAASKKLIDAAVAAHAAGSVSWDSIMAPLCEEEGIFSTVESVCTFPSHVSTDKALRDACSAADSTLSAYAVEAGARRDVYDAVLAYSTTEEAAALEGERKRCVERTLRALRRQGVHLQGEVAATVKGYLTRMSELGVQFSKNLGEEKTEFYLSAEQLQGMPQDWLDSRKQPDGEYKDQYKVTLKYPDYVPLMERCSVEATRKHFELAYNQRCMKENTLILEASLAHKSRTQVLHTSLALKSRTRASLSSLAQVSHLPIWSPFETHLSRAHSPRPLPPLPIHQPHSSQPHSSLLAGARRAPPQEGARDGLLDARGLHHGGSHGGQRDQSGRIPR